MTSRREFLRAGLIATTLPAVAQAGFARPLISVPTGSIYKVLYDTRFPASVAFGRRAAANGLAVHAIGGDITRFWYDDLYHRWREEPAAIAGLTAHGALFCLERLAWDQRMRVVYRGEHAAPVRGCVTHRFEGPAPLLTAAVNATAEGDWAAALADVVADCVHAVAGARAGQAPIASAVAASASEALYSWVIAPVSRG